ncbi:MAG: peptide chain release factor N(5)-glutamine methyltransferase [Chitinivibrionales bacterium]
MNTLPNLLKEVKTRIQPIAGECALNEAEIILQHVLHCSRSELYVKTGRRIPREQRNTIKAAIKRRLTDEPLPYILGRAYFHSKEFLVSNAVLIPRPDTEILVEKVLEIEPEDTRSFLDVGTGSGAIAEILVSHRPRWKSVGLDISEQALKIAKVNCSAKIGLLCGDLFSALKTAPYFDFIVSNPPYISEKEMTELDQSVQDFEPVSALYGGTDGLDFYRILAEKSKDLLKKGGRIYCEIGYAQGEAVQTLFSDQKWKNILQFPDLAGRPRIIIASQ